MKDISAGLRCQDVHIAVGEIDPNSANLTEIKDTRLIGMAASLATAIRGQDVVSDATSLEMIAAEQLDFAPYAFDQVVQLFEEIGWVTEVKRKKQKIVSFHESIPLHESIYNLLGNAWKEREPSEFENAFLSTVDLVAQGPLPEENIPGRLGVDKSDAARILDLAQGTDLVKSISTPDGSVLYSPFFFFENAERLPALFGKYGPDQLQADFDAVKRYQGLPVDDAVHPALADAVARGLIMAPTVLDPQNVERAFACIPYTIDKALLTVKRSILEKALAIVSCIRCGENFGGATPITRPIRIIDRLLSEDGNHTLSPHSSHQRQYQMLYRMQIVDFIPSGNWVAPRLITTDDNLAAMKLARDLIAWGEPLDERSTKTEEARRLLMSKSPYFAPIETVHKRRDKKHLPDKVLANLMRAAMGHAAL